MNKKQQAEQERADARAQLLESIKPGDTIYTIVRHVSRSGMYRAIDLYIMKDGEPVRISHTAAKLLEGYDNKHEACKASGCGMDMCFHLVYILGRVLFPEGFATMDQKGRVIGIRPSDGQRMNVDIGRGRNAGPMTKGEMDAFYTKGWKFEGGRNRDQSGWDNDGGYALKYRSL